MDEATAFQLKEFVAFFAASVFRRICVSEELKSSNNNSDKWLVEGSAQYDWSNWKWEREGEKLKSISPIK